MQAAAFEILGLEPTTDEREIRSAFVRLARIYHPDRFAGMEADVAVEAERRMKEVTEAYRALRAKPEKDVGLPPPAPWSSTIDPMEEARRYRAELRARREEAERDRKRWALWDRLEQQARQRSAWEAGLAANLAREYGAADPPIEPTLALPEAVPSKTPAGVKAAVKSKKGTGRSVAPREPSRRRNVTSKKNDIALRSARAKRRTTASGSASGAKTGRSKSRAAVNKAGRQKRKTPVRRIA